LYNELLGYIGVHDVLLRIKERANMKYTVSGNQKLISLKVIILRKMHLRKRWPEEVWLSILALKIMG